MPTRQRIRLATFNVNSVRSRLPILERWLPESGTDLLFLQETKATDADFPAAAFGTMGYAVRFRGEKAYNGVAAIAREPEALEDVTFGFQDGEEPDFPTRVALLRWRGLTVLNTYVPQGKAIDHPDYEVKKRFLDRVRALVEREADRPFAWVGDLNVAPSEIDVTNPANKKDHVCFHTDIRSKFAETAEGLTDVLRHFRPEPGEYTFFDYRVKDSLERNIGWRIDHILASPSLAGRALDCFVERAPRGWEKPSDHTPLVADFAF